MSKYSKFKKKAPLDGPLSIGPEKIYRDTLTSSQKEAEKVFDKWFKSKKSKKEQILRIGGGSGSGKAQPDDTLIPTPRGLKRLDELKVGDKVFNLDGREVSVLAIYPQGVQDTYKITFHDGRTTRCNLDHLWLVYTTTQKDKGHGIKPRVFSLREIMENFYDGKGVRYSVPRPEPIRFRRQHVSIDPYVMGVLIGNGCLSESALTISSGNMFVPGKVGELIGYPAYMKRYGNYSYLYGPADEIKNNRRKLLSTAEFMKDYPGLLKTKSHQKFIPDEYKYNSVDNRYRLIQGLMDTDGTISKRTYEISYTTTSRRLANDITEVLRSLGYEASITMDSRTEKYSNGECFHIHIHCPDADKSKLFMMKPSSVTKAKRAKDYKTRRRETLRMVKVEYVGKTSQRCILIDDPRHVYITENYIPTHNTHLVKYLVDKYEWDRSECYIVSYTGQSVNVMRQRGLLSTTIHSAFMVPVEEPVINKDTGKPIVRRGVPLMSVRFRPVPYIPPTAKLIIVDEASFLPESLEKILCRYNIPILEIGDPIQLPPVNGKQVFHLNNLNYFIEGVMRQAEDSDIYRLGYAFRTGRHIDFDEYGNDVRFIYQQETIEDTFYQFLPIIRNVDLIVTTTNKQRQIITDLYRKEIIRARTPFPVAGERLICRRNNPSLMLGEFILTNGTQGICLNTVGSSMIDPSTKTFCMDFKPDVVSETNLYYDNLICDSDYIRRPFGTDSMMSFKHPGEKFEYAHAITTHLIQGGSAPRVLFLDSFNRDQEYLNRIRYTAATRATYKLYYAIPYRGEWTL